jgi:solute carrier family 25 carnitine/acylcarnitine transporter 20/29
MTTATTTTKRRSWKDLHLGEEALGGLSAGIVGTVIGFPLDTVKTRMQIMQSSGGGQGGSSNNNLFQVARTVVKQEGLVQGLYKGIGPPLISLSVLGTLTFTQYSYFQEVYQSDPGWDVRNYLAGISCSPVAGMISTIENLVKVRALFVCEEKSSYRLLITGMMNE